MLLREIVEKNHYIFAEAAADWREAIRMSCRPLEADGTVEPVYAESIIACVEKHGPYIVILPDIALPHANENAEGTHGTAIGFMKLEQPVAFEPGNPEKDAHVFFTLASVNSDAHLANMQRLYEVLVNNDLIEELKTVTGPEDLLRLDAKYAGQATAQA